jgi:capsular exopolysaccharide synthesis family protein
VKLLSNILANSKARSKKNSVGNEKFQLITEFDPHSTVSEAYRILTTNLNFVNIDAKYKYIAVTSSLPAEGKSTTAANLAVALAQADKKVVIIDADLRRPSLHKKFGLKNFEGLTNVLVEGLDPLSACKTVRTPGLSILTTGPLPPSSSELLASNKMKIVLERLGVGVDFVIIDCPPILGLNDTLALAPSVDGFLFVVGSGKTPKHAMVQAKEQLEKIGANIIGAIVNGTNTLDSKGTYYYYYGEER